MMNYTEINAKVAELKDWEGLLEEAKAAVEGLRDTLKAELVERDVEMLDTESCVIRFTSVVSSRFDTKAFKEKMGADVYKAFTKEVASKRFTYSA